MKITENVDLSTLSYMKIGGSGKYLIELEKEDELEKIVEMKDKDKLPVIVLGEGSNTVISDDFHNKIFMKICIDDIIKTYEDKTGVNITVGAGVVWDDLVEWTVKNKFSGLELLSGIPGSVGSAPVQNIGAYGTDVSNTITHLNVFDLETEDFYEISNEDCQFTYRDSILKQNIGRFIVVSVSFRLSREKPSLPTYKDLALYFLKEKNKTPTIREIRKAVLEVRGNKIPDPKTDPNCGSFFKNPIITSTRAAELLEHFPDMPQFPVSENRNEMKLSGGWLIEKSGFKGKEFDNVRVSKNNALILITNGKATLKELEMARDNIITGVEKNFSIRLEVEPNFIY